jgi:hypothetical protein
MESITTRTLAEATGISDQEAHEIWSRMHESPFRKLIQYEIEIAQATQRLALETAPMDQMPEQKGIVKGMTICLGILARKDPKPVRRQ